jgi:hypothetical protein
VTVHVSIGNSDNRLTQKAWSLFAAGVNDLVRTHADHVHGEWYSPSAAPWQNACWGFEVESPSREILRKAVAELAREYDQHSVAWNESDTEML